MAIDTLGANALASNSVTSAKIADGAVVAADVADGSVTTVKLAADAVTTAKLADNAVTSAKSLNLGRRNILINGSFNHWQRGTSFSSNVYGADRWKFYAPGSHAYAQSTDTPDSPNNFKYSASCTGSGDATGLTQFVESINAVHIPSSGSTKVILSFYLKHTTNSGSNKITSSIGTLNSADNSGATTTRSTQNHNTTTSWARYTHEMTGADLTAAVTNGLQVTIKHNGSGSTVFLLTGCQLEISESVTDFERRSFGEELILCQRYLYQITEASASTPVHLIGYNQAGGACRYGLHQQMRAAPAVTTSNMQIFHGTGGTVNITSIDNLKSQGGLTGFRANPASAVSAGDAVAFYTNGTNAYIRFDSEL